MLALQITNTKNFMAQLLTGDCFDPFLLAEAVVSTAHTYTIDGHVNREFFTSEERENSDICPYDFALWQDMKGLLFQLIKGKHTPLYFKFVLHLKPESVSKLLAANSCSLPPEQIKALVLTIKYDGSHAVLTTGTAYHTFVMNKEPDAIWDKALTGYLSRKNIAYETL
ncbi:MAG: hypothetical protein K2I21_14970 [Acetatifactor sp.]|nr:hypothetical protein [Acetatifactor sp.]